MIDRSADAVRLQGYARRYRNMTPVRLVLNVALIALLALFATPGMVALGGVQLGLDLLLSLAVRQAARQADAEVGLRILRWSTGALACLMAVNVCVLTVLIRLSEDPLMRAEAVLLAIFALIFTALRLHMSRFNQALAILPTAATLIWLGLDQPGPWTVNPYTLAMAVFVGAVLAVTWRQQLTDHSLAEAGVALVQQNAALTAAVEEAQAASRAKSDLLAIASHEIRTPLNAVLGFAQALRGEALSPRQAELTQGVLDAGAQLTRLLDSVLDHSGMEAGKATLRLAPVDLRRVAQTVVRIWRNQAQTAGVRLVLEPPASAEVYSVIADEARVEQTLINLISNALKATPPGGRVSVKLAGERRGEALALRIEVRDSGPGVAPEDRERVFKAFEQTEDGRQRGGSGLGLAICAGNLALMGGEIGVEDAPEGGALFWFTFTAPIARTRARRVGAAAASVLGRPLRVLAAEDNPANRQVLATLLRDSPVALVFAQDGAEAVAIRRTQPFDLVLMDANMPVMDGLTALKEIRSLESAARRTPVWMLTANVFEADIARYHDGGADGVLRKPIDVVELFAVLADVGEAVARRG
ncbi:MAG: integral rane sensor hybrid histidine kinase, partial [Caulobacter sp.]|nr:integral rane sensor hybrid histidine kinase [Caulobacter sp.]